MNRFSTKQAGIISLSDLKTMKGKIAYWSVFAFLLFTCIFTLFPAIWVLLSGFKDSQEIYSGFSPFPRDMSLEHMMTCIVDSWKTLELGRSMINTVIMSMGSLCLTLIVCGIGGYVLSKMKPRGTNFVLQLVLWTMMMPGQLRTVPLYISWLSFPFVANFPFEVSLINTYWPIWLSSAANAFEVLLFKHYFDSIPMSYVEAAKLDGCGNLSIFFRIMMPLSKPIVIYVSIMSLTYAWSNFFIPYLVLQDKELQITPVRIYLLGQSSEIKMNVRFMGIIFASVVPFLIFAFFQKHIIGGVSIGGVKG